MLFKTDPNNPIVKNTSKSQLLINIMSNIKNEKRWYLLACCFDAIYHAVKDPIDFLSLVVYNLTGPVIQAAKATICTEGILEIIYELFNSTFLVIVGPTQINQNKFDLIHNLASQCQKRINQNEHLANNIMKLVMLKLNPTNPSQMISWLITVHDSKYNGETYTTNNERAMAINKGLERDIRLYKEYFRNKKSKPAEFRIDDDGKWNIEQFIKMVSNAKLEDHHEVVICLSAHADRSGDIQINDKKTFDQSKPFDFITTFLDNWKESPSNKLNLTLIVDTCYSGSILESAKSKYSDLNIQIICSCCPNEKSYGMLSSLICQKTPFYHITEHPMTWTSDTYRGSIPAVDFSETVSYINGNREQINLPSMYSETRLVEIEDDTELEMVTSFINSISMANPTYTCGFISPELIEKDGYCRFMISVEEDGNDNICVAGIQWAGEKGEVNDDIVREMLNASLIKSELIYIDPYVAMGLNHDTFVKMKKELELYHKNDKLQNEIKSNQQSLKDLQAENHDHH